MIYHISIRNFAIIENAEVDFFPGLNVITGETGAGKSILIEAVSLALGARADAAFIRSGAEKAVVQLSGELDGEEIVITREVSSSGRNLCKLNGELVTLAQLGRYCRKLADIHGQYDHQSLLDPDHHIDLIDLFGHKEIEKAKDSVREIYDSYRSLRSRLDRIMSDSADNLRKRDFMEFEINEIRAAALIPGEDSELGERISLLKNSEKISDNLSKVCGIANDAQPSAMDALSDISSLLSETAGFTDDLKDLSVSFDDLFYRLGDLFSAVRQKRDSLSFSPEELDESISRMETINSLKKKYGNSIEDIIAYADEREKELYDIDNSDEEKEKLETELAITEGRLGAASEKLTALRKKYAEELCGKISGELLELSFSDSRLTAEFEELPSFTENGRDRIQFLISTNKGEPLKPLAKIASGGEMSRIMLAFKNIVADYDDIPTLIFDEIDSGISGIAASVVGRKLCEIAGKHQIICITHLPQIAACGRYNFRIFKESGEDTTKTDIKLLSGDEKVDEIARLLGGTNVTDTTRKSAEELIKASEHQTAG